jgi:uncharacterized OB-fold protein
LSVLDGAPIAADLFTWPSAQPQLIGAKCGHCGAVSFPVRAGCPRCGTTGPERHLLGRRGTLWTWTSQGFVPKAPFDGTIGVGAQSLPWFVGVVELPGELRIEGLLRGVGADTVEIGMPMRLVVVPWRTGADGRPVLTFAFEPDPEGRESGPREEAVGHA